MTSVILRAVRVLVAQGLGMLANLPFNVPYLNITVGALLNALFKFLRDKFPKSVILEWLPL
jgi:hypothetical protein